MNIEELKRLIDKYFEDNPASLTVARLTDKTEFEQIDKKVVRSIPDWYKDILITYPLVDLEIGIPNDFGDEELAETPFEQLPLMGLTFLSVEGIKECSLRLHPDCELIDLTYIRIAEDKFGSQKRQKIF